MALSHTSMLKRKVVDGANVEEWVQIARRSDKRHSGPGYRHYKNLH